MAFCNSCGTTLNPDAQFCSKCGAAVTPGIYTPAPAPQATATRGSSSALKIVLTVVGVIVIIGVLGIATISFVAVHIARNSHVTQQGDHVTVQTPFGTISANDSDQAVKDLCVDVYPGAQALKEGASDATMGPAHFVVVNFESSDSVDQVCSFYKSKILGATVNTSDNNHCTIVSKEPLRMVTIKIEGSGNTTKFQAACVIRPAGSSN